MIGQVAFMFYGMSSPKARRRVSFITERQTRVRVEAKETRSHATTSVLFSRVLLIALLVLASCSILVSQARAAAPTVVTMPATGVTATSAVLHATVNPNGLATTWDFSNPPTTKIYCPSPPASLPADNAAHPVSCTAIGLTPSTYYEYIIRASNSGGSSFGSSVGFTTAGAGGPPTVVTMPATGVTATSAVLHATVNPNGLATTWDFSNPPTTKIYCPSPPASLPADNAAHPVSCTAIGLTPSTYYEYIVRASNGAGNAFGLSVGFTTAAPAATDWALSSPALSPASPNAGDAVTFGVILTALSSSQPYPQTATIVGRLDGMTIASESVTYPGPIGLGMDLYSTPPWTATAGTHTMIWQVTGAVPDPNPANNQASGTFTVGPPPALFDFDISVSPTEQTASPGGSVSYTVNVNLISGTTDSVSLSASGEPSGVTKTFSPSSGNPTFSSSLTLSVASSASPGTYSITVTGTGGGKTHTAAFTLKISQAKDFRIDVNPASLTVAQGQIASYSINVVALNGFNTQVSLSVSGFPPGASGVLSVPSGTPDFSTTFTVTLPSNVQTGSFTLTITGTGEGLTRVANVVLVITIQTQTQTQAQTTVTTATAATTPELLDMLQRNSLIIIASVLALAAVLGVLLMRGRSRRGVATAQQVGAPRVFCGKCGAENPTSSEFCTSCGNKLKSS